MASQNNDSDSLVGLSDLIIWVRTHLLLILSPVLTFLVLAIVYVSIASPRYKVEALLAPAEAPSSGQALSRLASQLGAGGLIGALPEQATNQSDVAVAVLESRRFLGEFIERHGLMPVLFESKWDKESQSWRDVGDQPSINDGYRKLKDQILFVNKDELTGFLTASIEWTDAAVAHAWLVALIDELNEDIRRRESEEATRSLEFLQEELKRTDLMELRQALYQLSLAELQKLTLSNVRNDFAFKVIDPPSLPDEDDPVSPNKPFVLMSSIVFGLFVGVLLAVFLTAWRASRSRLSDA